MALADADEKLFITSSKPPTGNHSRQPTSQPSGRKDRRSADSDVPFVYETLFFAEAYKHSYIVCLRWTPASAAEWRVVTL